MLCCETRSCYARRHNDLEGHRNFSSTIHSFTLLCLEHHYCGDQQWRSCTYFKVKSTKCLCLLPAVLVLVLRIWSCLHHCHHHQRSLQRPYRPSSIASTNGDIPVNALRHASIIWNLRDLCFIGTTWQSLPAGTRIPSCGNVRLQPQGLMCRDSCVKSSDMTK